MKISPDQLESQGYTLAHALPHSEMTNFVKTYIRKPNLYGVGYYALLFVLMTAVIYDFLLLHERSLLGVSDAVSWVSFSFALAFLLVPLHEYIHVQAYKSQGARNTSYDVHWRKLIFLAIADQFVAGKKEFRIIALAPFICISVILLSAVFLTEGVYSFVLLGVLFWHTSFCAGDFALLSYFVHHKNLEVITYDDKPNKISYFYTRPFE